ncbi:hypothetical protein [Kitasatospora sp. NPDC093806]|uniref:hypothetical protein n=1 Tax=Kitasatospora sp. NPDC093806 TaxID=3155075 RepID=UPI0034260CC0
MTRPPLLLLDVDGPLNPHPYDGKPRPRPAGYESHSVKPESWIARFPEQPPGEVKPLHLWLNPGHGAELLALPYELVWATAWMGEANTWISPLVGLPELPFIVWPRMHQGDPEGLHWKTRALVAWADGRPFVWVDDELRPQDTEWIAAHHPGPALTHWIDPEIGLRDVDFAALREWAAAA